MWSLASAKQQFSEVVRLAESEPQPIFRHNREVAVLLSARDYAEFRAWREAHGAADSGKTDGQRFLEGMAEIRQMLMDADPGYEGIELPPRVDRPNAMIEMLEQEFPYGENPDGTPRAKPLDTTE
jgi:prevent-host-death family protein